MSLRPVDETVDDDDGFSDDEADEEAAGVQKVTDDKAGTSYVYIHTVQAYAYIHTMWAGTFAHLMWYVYILCILHR